MISVNDEENTMSSMPSNVSTESNKVPLPLLQKIQKEMNVISTEEEYQSIQEFLDRLIDQVGENESHPLTGLMTVLGILVEHYEETHVPEL